MKINIAFHNVDKSHSLEEFVKQKSKKLEKFLSPSDQLQLVVEKDGKLFKPHLVMSLRGKVLSVEAKANNAFAAVKDILAKANRLLAVRHEKPMSSL